MLVYANGIQMTNKRLRIIFSVSPEENAKIKELAGISSMSAYIRSRIFGKDIEASKGNQFEQWIKFLSGIEDRDTLLENFIHRIKGYGNNPTEVFRDKLRP